jgi:hypothetical protein
MARKGNARKVAAPKVPSAKDRRRATIPGREEQGLGRAGRSGGTKSAGGKAARRFGGARGGWMSGGGVPSPAKAKRARTGGRPPPAPRPRAPHASVPAKGAFA